MVWSFFKFQRLEGQQFFVVLVDKTSSIIQSINALYLIDSNAFLGESSLSALTEIMLQHPALTTLFETIILGSCDEKLNISFHEFPLMILWSLCTHISGIYHETKA